MTRTNQTVLGASILLLAAACGGVHKEAAVATIPASGGACSVARNAKPIGHTGQGSTLALANIGGKRVALLADEDAKAILTFDLATRQELARTPLGTAPSQIYVANDGRIFVTLRQKNELVVLGAKSANAPLEPGCSAATPLEPIAIAGTPDGRAVAVTSGWGRKVTVFDSGSLAVKSEAPVAREPRSLVISDDGKTAFVAHAVGSVLTRVDLSTAKTDEVGLRGYDPNAQSTAAKARSTPHAHELELTAFKDAEGEPTCQGFALAKSTGRIFAPQVAVSPGELNERPDGYGNPNVATEEPAVAVLDEGNGRALFASMQKKNMLPDSRPDDPRNEGHECLLPRAAAVDPTTQTLLVTCFGIDTVVAYDATAASPVNAERRRWAVGSGPGGIVVDPEQHEAVVWSQFDRTVTSFPIGGRDVVDEKTLAQTRTKLAPLADGPTPEYALGRLLFHAAGDHRIAHDGRACASCHPDGRDDAITWATPDGPRRSIMLAGRATATAPYSWNGTETTLHGHLGSTFDRLSGQGIRSIELDALVAYFSAMPAPPASNAGLDPKKVARGKAIFASSEAGCATCHAGTSYSDGRNHDVTSKVQADRTAAFNTPSLHLVGGTGPYFHDGRYATLRDVLVKTDGTMGHTKHLTNDDLDALETFLRTL